MRNLKKFLALVLAMMMALSLMVTANAQNANKEYNDVGDATFPEAIDILTGMGVLKGSDGDFRPTETITRKEAVAVLYRLVTHDVEDKQMELYAPQAYRFTDVPVGSWYAGYVGFAVDAGLVKGYNGEFLPNKTVNGYEMLAMLLRAVGYGKNGEFTGDSWRINVGARAQSLGILDTIESTHYASTLSQGSAREVVAELTFQTATKVHTVNWTQLGGYSEYDQLLGGNKNPTLGEREFGLTSNTGIIVGNQATGESKTLVSVSYTENAAGEKVYGDPSYAHEAKSYTPATEGKDDEEGTPAVPGVEVLKLDIKTGLGQFGHKVTMWHNGDGKAYAWTDEANLTVIVSCDEAEVADITSTDDGTLGKVLDGKGFNVADTTAYWISQSFSRMAAASGENKAAATTSEVWVVISNNSDKKVDVVIPVEVAAVEIAKRDSWTSADKAVTIDAKFENGALGEDAVDGANTTKIKVDDIMSGTDNLIVDSKVIVTCVTNRTNKDDVDGSKAVYWVDSVPAPTVTGKVVKYDKNDQTVTLDNGDSYARTIIADAAIANGTRNYDVKETYDKFDNATYKFTLDGQGNWIHAEKLFENNFIYGTYIDYTTTLGSSEFTYTMVGIDLNGQQTTTNPTKYAVDGEGGSGTLGGSTDLDKLGIPSHGHSGGAGLKRDKYKGFIINGKTVDGTAKTLYEVASLQSLADDNLDATVLMNGDVDFESNESTTIGKDDITLSVAKVKTESGDLYLTEHTKFIVVEGYGTASAKAVIYNGISGLLGGSKNVTIATGHPAIEADEDAGIEAADAAGNTEILISTSPYVYANATSEKVRQVNVMILPKGALDYDNGSSLYFVSDNSPASVVDATGNDLTAAKLRTMYKDGVEVQVWVDAASETAITEGADGKANTFWNLKDTGDEAADGKPIYSATRVKPTADDVPGTGVCWSGEDGAGMTYKATTTNGQTAMLGDTLVNIASAKVINLNDGFEIEDMDDLNNLSSVETVTVCVQYTESGAKSLAYIYVIKPAAGAPDGGAGGD